MRITANFDAGNIDVISLEDKKNIELAIRPDVGGEFFQWFNFQLIKALYNTFDHLLKRFLRGGLKFIIYFKRKRFI